MLPFCCKKIQKTHITSSTHKLIITNSKNHCCVCVGPHRPPGRFDPCSFFACLMRHAEADASPIRPRFRSFNSPAHGRQASLRRPDEGQSNDGLSCQVCLHQCCNCPAHRCGVGGHVCCASFYHALGCRWLHDSSLLCSWMGNCKVMTRTITLVACLPIFMPALVYWGRRICLLVGHVIVNERCTEV